MTPEYFRIDGAERSLKRYPAGYISVPFRAQPKCPHCGAEQGVCEGPVTVRIHGGKRWPDFIGVVGASGPHFIVSGRVKEALDRIGCRGVRWTAAQISAVECGPRDMPPKYYWFMVDGRIQVDLVSFPYMPREKRCPNCDTRLEGPFPPQRFVPLEGSWDNSDFFKIENYKSNYVGCSRRILELARAERWTNVRFHAFDVCRRHALGWPGIDYLGRAWPPTSWYPEPKSKRRSYEAWLEWLGTNIFRASQEPLLDFFPEILTPLRRLVREGTELQRWNALWVLWYAYQDGYDLAPEEIALVEAIGEQPAPAAALRDRVLHGDEAERYSSSHDLIQLHREKKIELSPDEKAAILTTLPHLPPNFLD